MKTRKVAIHILVSILALDIVIAQSYDDFENLESRVTDQEDEDDGHLRNDDESSNQRRKLPLTSKAEFQILFKQRREEHLKAVKVLLSKTKYDQKYSMVQTVMTKMFEMIEDGKAKLESSGYTPGLHQDLPGTQKELESLSSVLENCAFLGDIVLHLPDISKRVLASSNKWLITTNWCISFTNSTGLLDSITSKMVNLVAQELNLIPRDESYFNPYSEEFQQQKQNQRSGGGKGQPSQQQTFADKKSKQKKIKKGPRLSKRVEL